ncbi:MAG: hypothetical protein GWP91_06895 [Rhodobacterales bacterium]|nr:hypothetical protein [Rhodobacterales bacterium]
MNRGISLGLLTALVIGSSGCDYTGDWLFAAKIDGVPGVIHVTPEAGDGEYLVPAVITSDEELRAATIYVELGPTGTVEQGGATFNFQGIGGPVCIWADPEVAFWSQAVATNPDELLKTWTYPDNGYDDGDIDLYAGLSAYYTGSPGVRVGDFEVSYTDSLGNPVPIELASCTSYGLFDQANAHSGRGYPEACDIDFTDLGVSYTGLLQSFSTPLDDDRLGVAFIVAEGTCAQLAGISSAGGAIEEFTAECLLMGEAMFPNDVQPDPGPHYGYDSARAWSGSEAFELAYCQGMDGNMKQFCRQEAEAKFDSGGICEWSTLTDPANRCFCGDPLDTPSNGAL